MGAFDKTMSVSESNQDKTSTHTPWLSLPLIGVIRGYQLFISPILGQNCRFHPSCSCYATDALKQHGLAKGSMLAIKRISKCHPMHPGGVDHVPERKNKI